MKHFYQRDNALSHRASTYLMEELMNMKNESERQEKMMEWLCLVIEKTITHADELDEYIPGGLFYDRQQFDW